MSSKNLIAAMAANSNLSQAKVKGLLDELAMAAAAQLRDGEDVTLPGLGKLKAKPREARVGRNPKTGGTVEIPAKTVVKFTPAKALADAVN